jgi:alpha-mannosidase
MRVMEETTWKPEGDMRLIVAGLGLLLLLALSPNANGKATDLRTGSAQAIQAARPWQTVWRIGRFDQSSMEFNPGAAPVPAPVYVIGTSTPAKDWYAFQPGTGNGLAGDRSHPVTIQFDLPGAPRGLYAMKVALLVEHPRISALDVAINGHTGRFYQYPKLNYASGDLVCAFLPIYSTDIVQFNIPASFLLQGTNHIVLTAVDEPEPGDQTTSEGIPIGDSGVVYDALELEHESGGKYEAKSLRARVSSTIYYRQEGGELLDIVDAVVRSHQPLRQGRVELRMNGKVFQQVLASGRAFGEQRLKFAVPAWTGSAQATLAVHLGGRTRRFRAQLTPGKKWTFYLVPSEHLDVGYSDYQAKVEVIHSRMIDEAMKLAQKYPGFQWNLDAAWEAHEFLQTRTNAQKAELGQMIREGKIRVPAQDASLLTGFPSVETLIRSLYRGYAINKKYGGPWDYASITDVPSYAWSYASILADAGLKYFVAGSDNYRAPILLLGHLNEKSPFWWEGPDGQKILMWYSRHYMQMTLLFGLPPQIASGHDALPLFLQSYDHPWYRAHAVILYGTQVENTDVYPQQGALVDQWNKIYAYPKLEFSGFGNAMSEIKGQFGNSIPTYRGSGGPYWEDGIASDARYAAMERRNEARALTAEKFSTVSALVDPAISPDRTKIDHMWNDMVLMDEHTFGAYDSITAPHSREAVQQLAVKNLFAIKAHELVGGLMKSSLASIANRVKDPSDTLLVFNGLNWERSGLVDLDLDDGSKLVDLATGQAVPYELLRKSPSYSLIRFMASNVPALGYKAYKIEPTQQKPPGPTSVGGDVLENQYYRVTLDPESGAVRSVYDKELGRELVNTSSAYRFDQYLYVAGADKLPNRVIHYRLDSPLPVLHIHPAGDGKLVSIVRTPFGTVAKLESSCLNTPRIETQIILLDHAKKIEFIDRIEKKEIYRKEAVYFSFPFAIAQPEFRYEIQNGVVNPAKDMLPGAGLEWFSVQHWAAVRNPAVFAAILPIDASLVTLGDVFRGDWPTDFGKRPATIFSYVMNNYWDTNYTAAQGGKFTFRYVLTSGHQLHIGTLSRLGWAEMSPLETDQITQQDKAMNFPQPLSSVETSFLHVNQPNVVLLTWKEAENGQGTILRFLEIEGKAARVGVDSPLLNVQAAWQCSAMEANQQQLSLDGPHGFSFEIQPHQIVTVRVKANPVEQPANY